jgi:hypothetical protein
LNHIADVKVTHAGLLRSELSVAYTCGPEFEEAIPLLIPDRELQLGVDHYQEWLQIESSSARFGSVNRPGFRGGRLV